MRKSFALFMGMTLLVLLDHVSAKAQQPTATPAPVADCADLPAMSGKLQSAQTRLKDWPNLARYREVNARLTAPAKKEHSVVFMGDSITDGWTRPEYGGFFPGKPYVDRGISGQTTPQMLVRFRPDVISLQPKVVVILAGTNDLSGNTGPMTVAETEDNLASMSELARAHKIWVVLASILPVSNYGHDRQGNPIDVRTGRSPEKILEINTWMKKHAADNGYVYLDYFSAMVDAEGMLKKELSGDGLHPNAAGYAVMSPLAEQAIQAALKKRK